MLAIGNRLQDKVFGNVVAADQFNDNIDIRVVDNQITVRNDFAIATDDFPCPFDITVGNHGDFNTTTRATPDFFLVTLQYIERTGTDGSQSQNSNFYRLHISLMNK